MLIFLSEPIIYTNNKSRRVAAAVAQYNLHEREGDVNARNNINHGISRRKRDYG